MVSNVSHYAFDPGRDEYFAYELSVDDQPRAGARRRELPQMPGQIRFEAPCVSLPDSLTRYTYISIEQLEIEMERAARLQEREQ